MNGKQDLRASHDDLEHLSQEQIRAQWRSLFEFMNRRHAGVLAVAILLSIASGIVVPTLAYFLGRIFNLFADYAVKQITGATFSSKVSRYCLYLVALGSANWLLNGGFFAFWVAFGELQANSARQKLYDAMLHKEIAWYDTRRSGMSAIIPRFQA